MKGVILYSSKYGSSKKYAEWIADETHFDCAAVPKANIGDISEYDTIIFTGGIYASGIAGLPFLKKNMTVLSGKRIAVFCVGASPYDANALKAIYEHNFKGDAADIPCFYGRGAWDESKMTLADRMLCKMLQKAVSKKPPDTYEIWEKELMCAAGQSCDWTDKKYLKPLLEWLNGGCSSCGNVN